MSMMNFEPPAKRPKLDAVEDEDKEKARIPDDVLFKIFSLLSVRDRMRLSLVSKRFRQLVSKRPVWKDINSLSLTLDFDGEGTTVTELRTTLNGLKFNTQTRTKALHLLDYCAPFKSVEVSVLFNSYDDMAWMSLFLARLLEAQTAAGKGGPPELCFRGSLVYAPTVIEKLVDGTQKNIHITIGRQKLQAPQWEMLPSGLRKMWSQIATCDGLTEFNFDTVRDWLFNEFGAATAVSGKQSLQRLCFKMRDRDERHDRFIRNLAAVANSCPSLVALHCEQALFGRDSAILAKADPLIPILESATRQRLQELTVSGTLSLKDLRTLATQFPNLTELNVNLKNGARFIEYFLAEHQLEDKVLNLNLGYAIGDFENHRVALFESSELLCDCFAMAQDGRFAFVKGSALVACKFVQANWPGPDLERSFI